MRFRSISHGGYSRFTQGVQVIRRVITGQNELQDGCVNLTGRDYCRLIGVRTRTLRPLFRRRGPHRFLTVWDDHVLGPQQIFNLLHLKPKLLSLSQCHVPTLYLISGGATLGRARSNDLAGRSTDWLRPAQSCVLLCFDKCE